MKKALWLLFRWILLPAVIAALSAAAFAMSRPPAPGDMRISIEQLSDARLRVTYDLDARRRELIFKIVPGGYRARRWTIETPGFRLLRLDTEDRIIRTDGSKFDRITLVAAPDIIRLPKEYQPVARYGEGGALIYTGHFWPMTRKGGRTNATFSFSPAAGGEVVAFGVRKPALMDWRSPMAHPAFVYMGPLAPVETDQIMAIVDPNAPPWIVDEFYRLAPKIFDYLAKTMGFEPLTKPNLFLAAPLGHDEGRLSYAGDALPGQFQITLAGAAWKNSTPKAKSIFRRSTIHEALHLWQSAAARPGIEETAPWIHEGGADAAAAEAMLALGFWDGPAFEHFSTAAQTDCAKGLNEGPLTGAEKRGAYRAIYACGVVIAEAVARADGTTATAFWRDFMIETGRRGSYSDDFFYDFVEQRTGDKAFARALRYFVETPLANPRREIARLMQAAALAPKPGR